MRVLLTADLHYSLPQFDWVQQAAADFDAVVLAGDLLDIASPVPVSGQLVAVLKHLEQLSHQTTLLVSSGNHDLTTRNENGEKTASWMDQVRRLGIPCDGASLQIDGFFVTICPWWDGPRACETVAEQLATAAPTRGDSWIWLYHAPPSDSPTSWAGRREYGDEHLRRWIEQYQPTAVFCGHIHNAPFLDRGAWDDRIGDTWVFNAGRQIGPVPCHVVLDTDERTASWRSLAGEQSRQL